MNLTLDDLNDFGRARLEDDFQATQRRDGGKTSRTDFALGWMAAMVRIRQWTYFTVDARRRIEVA
jgi:hypothetical protein